jgi:hypothetical protein
MFRRNPGIACLNIHCLGSHSESDCSEQKHNIQFYDKLKLFTAAIDKISIFWHVTSCNLVVSYYVSEESPAHSTLKTETVKFL